MTDTNTDHLPISSPDIRWSHRLTIIRDCGLDLSKPQVVQKVCDEFKIIPDEVAALLNMEESGDWQVDPSFDTTPYRKHFDGANDLPPLAAAVATAIPTASQTPIGAKPAVKPTKSAKQPPATASRPKQTPRKRGRKGSKIQLAFRAVPTEPVDAESFAKKYQVSMAVLRQSKRFDKDGDGAVRVKQNDDKVLMIWREPPESEKESLVQAEAVAGEGITTEVEQQSTQSITTPVESTSQTDDIEVPTAEHFDGYIDSEPKEKING